MIVMYARMIVITFATHRASLLRGETREGKGREHWEAAEVEEKETEEQMGERGRKGRGSNGTMTKASFNFRRRLEPYF